MFKLVLIIFINLSLCQEERFFWENDYVGKPVNFYHGAAYQIPVIEGEEIEIKCKVRAVSEDPYTIIWDYEKFHANTTGMTVLVNNTDGDEYAQDSITVTIDNPADIDEKDIICSWENGKFSDTITLQFKVYVFDSLDLEESDDKDTCEGYVQLKLKRPKFQKKEDINLEEKIKQKVLRRRDYDVSDILIDSEGKLFGCEPASTSNTTNQEQEDCMEEQGEFDSEGYLCGGEPTSNTTNQEQEDISEEEVESDGNLEDEDCPPNSADAGNESAGVNLSVGIFFLSVYYF